MDLKNENTDELQMRFNLNSLSLNQMLVEKDRLLRSFFEESRKMQRLAREHVRKVQQEQEMLSIELESKKKRLDAWSRELNKREVLTDREKQKLDEEKKQNEERYLALQMASAEQRKADENVLTRVEEQKNMDSCPLMDAGSLGVTASSESSSPDAYPSPVVDVAGAANGLEQLSVPVDVSAPPSALQKKDAAASLRRATIERTNICIYIAYNGKWTKNKYIDHETRLILVSDDITFEGLVEGIFHVLKLERSENEVNVWFDAKLETSKGMLVTNDEEVTTCFYLLKNDSSFKNSHFIVDIVERNSLSPKSSNTESRRVCDEVNIVQQEERVGNMDSERHKGLTVEPTLEPEFLTPKARAQGTGQTSTVKKIRKRSRNTQNDLTIMVLREDASLDEIVEGSLFEDKETLKKCFSKNAIKHNFKFKVKKSSKSRWSLRCYSEGCGWCMRSLKVRDSALFQISKFVQDHTCLPEQFKSDQWHVTPKLISDHIMELLRDAKVEIKPNFVMEEIKRKYGLNIGYHKAWRSIQKAFAIIGRRPDNSDSEQVDSSSDSSLFG